MKKNKGVTLVSLVVVILILFILSSVTIQVGIRVYNEAKVENYVSRLKVIQAKVDNLAEETDDVSSYGFIKLTDAQGIDSEAFQIFNSIIQDPNKYNITEGSSWNNALDSVIDNYYYFSPKDLEKKLGLKNQDMTVAINFKTRNVISKSSLKMDDKFYHRQYDVARGSSLIENSNTVENPIETTMAKKVIPANYGDKVNYTANGVSDWKIFYNDGANVYIIAGDYVPVEKLPTALTGMNASGNYTVCWNSVPSFQSGWSAYKDNFLMTAYTLNDSYNNSKCVSTLLNSDNWSVFSSGKSQENHITGGVAIGSPTLEMWVASWNAKGYSTLYCNNTSDYGYFIGTSSEPTTSDQFVTNEYVMNSGFSDALYFPHTNKVDNCNGYWLASTSSWWHTHLMYIFYDAHISGRRSYQDTGFAVRPVVRLNANVKGVKISDSWILNE